MKIQMTAFAFAGKCGFRGARGSSTSPASASIDFSARAPKPQPAFSNSCLLVHIDELAHRKEDLGQVGRRRARLQIRGAGVALGGARVAAEGEAEAGADGVVGGEALRE